MDRINDFRAQWGGFCAKSMNHDAQMNMDVAASGSGDSPQQKKKRGQLVSGVGSQPKRTNAGICMSGKQVLHSERTKGVKGVDPTKAWHFPGQAKQQLVILISYFHSLLATQTTESTDASFISAFTI